MHYPCIHAYVHGYRELWALKYQLFGFDEKASFYSRILEEDDVVFNDETIFSGT